MPPETFRVGITRDTLRADGTSIFAPAALQVFDDPRYEWEFLDDNPKELTAAHAARYDALGVLNPRVTAATLAGPDRRLKIVARMGVGYDSIDVPACTANGVILTNTPDGVRRPVATSILLLMLALTHKLRTKDAITRAGRWAETTNHMGDGLTGKTIGSIGMGNIGSELFRLLAPLEMAHLAFDPYAQPDAASKLRVRLTDKDTVLRESDVVCINCPLTPETRHLLGAREFALMKPTAYLINTARGPIVDERAAHRALVEGRIAGAALDVFEQEPITADHPLAALHNVILTPHSICWTDEFFRNNAESAFRSITAVATGQTPTYVVNRDVLTHPDVQARKTAT
ncbi:MAG: NAD(P)-dependent oxidoreductase [Acidobacteria bacterium]|nr:NAD(P)-dependent oxidoreductase [Acidobacteriota bacterium]